MSGESAKLSKESLKEDEFVEWIMRTVDYVREHVQLFIGGFIALVVLILAVNYVITSQEQGRNEAATLLGDALIAEENGQLSEAFSLFRQLVDRYGGTPAAAQGRLMLANRYFAQGNYSEAQRLYEESFSESEKTGPLAFAAWSGLAACLDAQGQLQEAAHKYQQYAVDHPGTAEAALALLAAARCYDRLGEREAKNALLRQIARDYPELPVAQQARAMMETF